MTTPRVTIITVVLNDSSGFRKTADSILAQDYPDVEWIVVDGGSADGTVEEIKKKSGHIAWWVSEPDHGFYDAMSKGLRKAGGEWVNFMNAGDCFAGPDVIRKVMEQHSGAYDVIYGDSYTAYTHRTVLRKAGPPATLIHGMNVCHQSVFVRTLLAREAGFDLRYAIGADFDMLLKLHERGSGFLYLPMAVAVSDPSGISNRRMHRSAKEHYVILGKHRSLSFTEHMRNRVFIGYTRILSMLYSIVPERVMHRVATTIRRINAGKL
jgi:glycosyltransferase involved in cell wall biosynthesis